MITAHKWKRLQDKLTETSTSPDRPAKRNPANASFLLGVAFRRAEDPLRVAVAGAADVAVIKCTPLGGVRRSLQVAEAAGLPCVVSSALETSVGLSAQLALAGALPELDFACGLGTLSLLTGDVVPDAESLRPVNGYLPIRRTPPTPDAALLDAYELTDAAQAAWWRDRLTRVRAELDRARNGEPSA